MKLARAIWFLFVLILVTLVFGVAWLMSFSYSDFVNFALEQLHRPDLKNAIEQNFFPLGKFSMLQRAGYSIIPVVLAILGFFIAKRKMIWRGIQALLRRTKNYFGKLIQSIKESNRNIQIALGTLLLLVLIRSIYYALHFYPQYDECWNYNYFLSNNFFTSLFAYNNYPLHNLLTYGTLSLLPDSTFVMRLPNIVLGLINIILVFVLTKRIFRNEKLALAASTIFAVLPTIVFYMLFSRGVMLSLTFSLLLLFFFLVKKIEGWKKTDILLVAMLAALGSFSMISFPVFLIVLFLLYIIKPLTSGNYASVRKLWYSSIWIVLFTGILYLPMLLGSGFELGLSSNYTNSDFYWLRFIEYTQLVSDQQIASIYGAPVFILLGIILLLVVKRKVLAGLSLVLILLPYILILVWNVNLPARALGFQSIGYLFIILLILEFVFRYSTSWVLYIITAVLVLGWNYRSTHHTFFDWSARPDKGAFKISQVLRKEKVSSFYDMDGSFSYFVPGILYHHKIQGKEIQYRTKNERSARYQSITKYSGNYFVTSTENYKARAEDKILYQYQDEDKAFTVYKRSNR